MLELPAGFPDALLRALPSDPTPDERALIEAPALVQFWTAIAAHMGDMIAAGWNPSDAAGSLVGGVLTPPRLGYDAHGSLSRRVREGVDMQRRHKAASLARDLSALLTEIGQEALPPDAALTLASLLDQRTLARDVPSHVKHEPTPVLLKRLAAALEVPPNYTTAPGLASQKASWRGFIREVRTNLTDLGFDLRERVAVALVHALCGRVMAAPPSRAAVQAALRGGAD